MKLPLCFLSLLLTILLPAQSGRELSAPAGSSPDTVQEESPEVYRLRPDDKVQLDSYAQPLIEGISTFVASVGRDGGASFPLINSVPLKGLSVVEANQLITDLYAADYLVNPSLSLRVIEYAQEYVTVSGQVVASGPVRIPDHGQLSLFTAITNAGGLTSFADEKRIQLFMADGKVRVFSLEEIRGDVGKSTFLDPSDQVVVPKNRFADSVVSVQGEVGRPGNVAIPPKSGKLDLNAALVSAGGLGPEGDPLRIKLIRADDNQVSFFTLKGIQKGNGGGILLRGGDRILVPKSPFVGKTVSVEGEVGQKGFVPFPMDGKLTLSDAITHAGGFSQLANGKVVLKRPGFKAKTYDLDDLAEQGLVIPLQPDDTIVAKRRIF